VLHVDGQPLMAETVRAEVRQACAAAGAPASSDLVVASVWQGLSHDPGAGPLPAGLPIQIDLWPRDETSGCFADMTRTFLVGGEVPAEVRRQLGLVSEVREALTHAIRPGALGHELYDLTCDMFESDGYRTQRTGGGSDGFQFALGHGVGLRVHEPPGLGRTGHQPLMAGDVLAVEPGLWDEKVGGYRYEDIVLVTEHGCETLTDYPYALTP
jgi:Xaa-Pro aminopeptidase